jgi:MFS family permease
VGNKLVSKQLGVGRPTGWAIRNGGGTLDGHSGVVTRHREADSRALRVARTMTLTQGARAVRPRRWWRAGLAWVLWTLTMLGIAASLWWDHLLRQAGRADLVQPTTNALPWLLALVSAPTVGAVLATRRSRHPVGWLLLGLGASIGLTGFTDGYALYGLLARPGWLPAARWTAIYGPAVAVAGIGCLGFVLLLTPTGSLPPPRWRWWARVAAAAPVVYLVALTLTPEPLDSFYRPLVTNPLGLRAPLELPIKITRAAVGVTVVAVPVGTLSLVVRFRRVRGTERQQLRWVALAALLAALAILMALAGMITGNTAMRNWGIGVSFAVLPPAIGAAILRYRLYDLDRILSRTLAYGLLTVLLAGGYAVVVLGLGQLLGGDSSLVVAAATLAVAAMFQPARRRIQTLVDRRFNRRRHDAARTIAAFSGRLRDQVDLGTLTAELLSVVDQTMQPTRTSLWLRDPAGSLVCRAGEPTG